MVKLEQYLINMPVNVTSTVVNATGTFNIPGTITFGDVCSKDFPGARCNMRSPLVFWGYNTDTIINHKDNLLSFLQDSSQGDEDLFLPVNVTEVFGGITRDSISGNITGATHMKFIYYTNALKVQGGTNDDALAWQAAVLQLLKIGRAHV